LEHSCGLLSWLISLCFLRPSIFWYKRFPLTLARFRYFTMAFWRLCYCSGSYSCYWGLLSIRLFSYRHFIFSSDLSLIFYLGPFTSSCIILDLGNFFSLLCSSLSCSESLCSDCSVSSILTGDILILFSRTFSGEGPFLNSENYPSSFRSSLLFILLSCFGFSQDNLKGVG